MTEANAGPTWEVLPTGTVTFLYTDIEGSTRLWQEHPAVMPRVIERHDALLRELVTLHSGIVFRTMGDAICAAFPTASEALAAAVGGQRALLATTWDDGIALRVRMALHSGAAETRQGDYVGHTLNRVARLMAAGHGGQILLSGATYELVRDQIPSDTEIRDLGEHRLKDLVMPERIYQACVRDLPAEFPPLRTIDAHPTNLPVEPTSYVGRERETQEVVTLLRQDGVRLLTLTGPGGTGKTRLSVRAGAMLLGDFPDGVFFVSLGSVADPALLAPTIVAALGIQDVAGQPLETTLQQYLRDKRLLLVLDNFEHLTERSPLVADILTAAPHVKMLVTSRSVLRLSTEHDYAVPPLAIPDVEHLPTLEALSQYDAVALFIQRARAARADFMVTNENAPAVAEICARLDGLPLAIELAAARVRLFPPQSLLRRLESRLQTLTGGALDLPARQQTLRGALDWSHSLLTPDEQRLLARLSIFAGPWTLEAAEEICNEDNSLDLLQGVESLVEKSLLRQEDREGEPYFSMLQTIREYAMEKLQQGGEAGRLQERHAAYFLQVAQRYAWLDAFAAGTVDAGLQVLDAANEDVRFALAAALDRGDAGVALTLSSVLATLYWYTRGYWHEGKRWLESALALPAARDLPGPRAHALVGLGSICLQLNDYPAARANLEEGVALAGADDPWVVFAIVTLGWVAAAEGDLATARRLMEDAAVSARQTGNAWIVADILHSLGALEMLQQEYDSAATHLHEALAFLEGKNMAFGTGYVRNSLGDLARIRGDYHDAEAYYLSSLDDFEATGNASGRASANHNLGYVSLHNGNTKRAAERFMTALGQFRTLGDRRGMAECLIGLAAVAAARNQPKRAAQLHAVGAHILQDLGAVQHPTNIPDSDTHLDRARSQIPEEIYRAAWEDGWAMDLEAGVKYALEVPDLTAPAKPATG
jgi:predicted ATPase/class 3 adenylate cyclase/Tfp pilus assembly protein PilF